MVEPLKMPVASGGRLFTVWRPSESESEYEWGAGGAVGQFDEEIFFEIFCGDIFRLVYIAIAPKST